MAITRARKSRTPPPAKPATAEDFIAAAAEPAVEPAEAVEAVTVEAARFAPDPAPLSPAREHKAQAVVERHMPWAAAAGLVPVPAADLAAIFGVQLRMLAKLGDVYDVPFREQAARSAIAALMAGILQRTLAGGLAAAMKFVPVIGTLAGMAALPALAAAGTYALGRVFIVHFEAGGTFLDLDPERMRAHFRKEFDAAPALLSAAR